MSLFGDRLFTRRLILSKIREDDLQTIVTWSRSKIACGSYLNPENYDIEQMRTQINSGGFWGELEKMFLVSIKDRELPIGTVHYWRQPAAGKNSITMALKVALPEERGKGYGTEIQKFLIMHLFDRLSVEVIEMYTDIDNIAQQRCLQKLGFELVESLVYDDQQEKRTGHLFRLTSDQYHSQPIYQYHYE
ncbi:hypothetical protein DGMP_29100 [Desulfomarina profundi]|uniref:N-acetyltransferase domain-containing protein n=1 Tax=Desulfomarina profundi TaxID=2772557 RepID=A0A8D5FIF5_9BACT|nr:GNAT family protein [Desulfomarina profundi]BCL62217.1 hypothetical protein DGMP_29100 [Desulfomarina profundi]